MVQYLTLSQFPQKSLQSFKTQILPLQNSYGDHRNFDSVNQSLHCIFMGKLQN